MYKNVNNKIFIATPKTLNHMIENNFVMGFSPLTRNNCIIGDYPSMKARSGPPTNDSMQNKPDVIIQWDVQNYNKMLIVLT
jgi:hypothetical protein